MIQSPQGFESRVAALEEAVRQLQESAPLTAWDWLVRIGGLLAVLLTVLRISDHFANRARIAVTVKSARFRVRYTDTSDIYHDEHDSPPENAANVHANTSVEIDLELRNIGRAATTFCEATLKTKHSVLGNREMKRRTNDLFLAPIEALRLEPSDVTRVTVHSLLHEELQEPTIAGRLDLMFTDKKKRCRLTLERQPR